MALLTGTAQVSVEEYLATVYRPDRDLLDGELKERNLGERPYALLQAIFAGTFATIAGNGRLSR